jgi:hypothetical protein
VTEENASALVRRVFGTGCLRSREYSHGTAHSILSKNVKSEIKLFRSTILLDQTLS